MAVALEYQERYEEALNYALKANSITGESFPLFLVNRACILMRLGRKDEAIRDLNRSKKSMAESSKEKRLWDNNENRVFIEKQLKRYGSLMEPIEDFKE